MYTYNIRGAVPRSPYRLEPSGGVVPGRAGRVELRLEDIELALLRLPEARGEGGHTMHGYAYIHMYIYMYRSIDEDT